MTNDQANIWLQFLIHALELAEIVLNFQTEIINDENDLANDTDHTAY